MNRGQEDYIKEIYTIQSESPKEWVSNQQLSVVFSHTIQTVNEMVKKLDKQGYLVYTPYRGSVLSQAGKDEALRLLRIHRIWEYFLLNCLDYSWDEVHQEAERLEHVTSTRMEKALYNYLGKPKYCPIGKAIPDMDGHMERRKGIKLWEGISNKDYKVILVEEEIELLKYLSSIDVKIENTIKILDKDSIGEYMTIENNKKQLVIGKKVAEAIYIK